MFTWNLQYVSKKRLADTLNQLMIDGPRGHELLIRIHTAIHTAAEAVELAAFIKQRIPEARILGTSTAGILVGGKLIHDQCVISITQMAEGSVRTVRVPLREGSREALLPAGTLCSRVKDALVGENTRLVIAFFTAAYPDVNLFVEETNRQFPGVQMIGGVTEWNDIIGDGGFVFDENGWSAQDAIFAALSGDALESVSSFATGVQVVGE